MANSEWRPVVGWERFYEISEAGDVRRIPGPFATRCDTRLKRQGRYVVLCSREEGKRLVRLDDIYSAAFPERPPLPKPPRKPVVPTPMKLTDKQVIRIRQRLATEHRCGAKLASEYGVSREMIRQIKNRRAWKHI